MDEKSGTARRAPAKYGMPPTSSHVGNLIAACVQCIKMRHRIRRTTSDRSADAIPKVSEAGSVRSIDGRKVQIMHNGVKVAYGAYHGHWMARIIRQLRGHHEPFEELFFHHIVRRLPHDASMLELGCYWAYYSLWFRHDYPKRRNYVVEPNPEKLAVGRLNFELNGYSADFLQRYVAARSDRTSGFQDWDGRFLPGVGSIGIDDYLSEKALRRLHLLHADIQGAELDMLAGAERAISDQCIDYLFISTHGDCHPRVLAILQEHEYRIVVEHSIEQSSSADGLIVAASQKAEIAPETVRADCATALERLALQTR